MAKFGFFLIERFQRSQIFYRNMLHTIFSANLENFVMSPFNFLNSKLEFFTPPCTVYTVHLTVDRQSRIPPNNFPMKVRHYLIATSQLLTRWAGS